MRRPVVGSVQRLLGLEDRLNELDARVGDGDTGSTLAIGAKAILQFIDDLPRQMHRPTPGHERRLGWKHGRIERCASLDFPHFNRSRVCADRSLAEGAREWACEFANLWRCRGRRSHHDRCPWASQQSPAGGRGLPRAAEMARAGAEVRARWDRAEPAVPPT